MTWLGVLVGTWLYIGCSSPVSNGHTTTEADDAADPGKTPSTAEVVSETDAPLFDTGTCFKTTPSLSIGLTDGDSLHVYLGPLPELLEIPIILDVCHLSSLIQQTTHLSVVTTGLNLFDQTFQISLTPTDPCCYTFTQSLLLEPGVEIADIDGAELLLELNVADNAQRTASVNLSLIGTYQGLTTP